MNEIEKNIFKNNKNKNMKKKIFILISLLFILFFIGCQEEVVDSVPLETPKVTVKVSLHGTGGEVTPYGNVQLPEGETLKISVLKETGVIATATIDGNNLPLQKSKIDGSYFFRTSQLTANAVVDIEFEKGIKWQLAQHPWNYYSRDSRLAKDGSYFYTSYAKGYAPVDTVGYIYGGTLPNMTWVFEEDTMKVFDVNKKLVGFDPYTISNDNYMVIGKNGMQGKIEVTDSVFKFHMRSPYYESYPDKPVPELDRITIEKFIK